MALVKRLKRAYETGGIGEIFRKAFYYAIYKINGCFTALAVKLSRPQDGLNRKEKREVPVVVSLTSYPARFSTLPLTLKSLLRQNRKPDRLIVWLGSDTAEEDITPAMRDLEKYGVEYRIDPDHNYKSHKKYYYAMKEFPDAITVTADDDLFYPKNWLKTLLKGHQKYPDCVICRRTHLIRRDENGILPYALWVDQCRSVRGPSFSLVGTSGSGKLYPPHSLDERALDPDAFMNLCVNADDLWVKCMEILAGRKAVFVRNWKVDLRSPRESQKETLETGNVGRGENDLFLKQTMDAYGIAPDDFFRT